MKKRSWIILIILLALLLVGSSLMYSKLSETYEADTLAEQDNAHADTPQEPGEEELPMAPDFTVYDEEGNAVRLSDFLGKPVVLNFWASWCGPCQSEMPGFEAKFQEYGNQVQFLMVNMTTDSKETQEAARALIEAKGYTFPVFYDLDSDAAITYGVYALPTTYFIDAEGHGIAVAQSAISEETLLTGIEMILSKEEHE